MSLITAGFKPIPTVSRSPNQEQPCSVSQIEWNPQYPKNGRRQNFQQIFKKKSSNVYSTNLSAAKQTERNCWALKHYLQSAKRDHLVGIRKQKKLRRVSGEAKKNPFLTFSCFLLFLSWAATTESWCRTTSFAKQKNLGRKSLAHFRAWYHDHIWNLYPDPERFERIPWAWLCRQIRGY